jgi:hypothetical protein
MADKIGVPMGPMIQISDSLHVYVTGPGGDVWRRVLEDNPRYDDYPPIEQLFAQGPEWDEDLNHFFECYDKELIFHHFKTPYFRDVVQPMWLAHQNRSVTIASEISALDWRKAAVEWLNRRLQKLSAD